MKTKEHPRKILVKVQLPLSMDVVKPLALIYDKTRSFRELVPITPRIMEAMAGNMKDFFHAEINEAGAIELLDRAPWQDW